MQRAGSFYRHDFDRRHRIVVSIFRDTLRPLYLAGHLLGHLRRWRIYERPARNSWLFPAGPAISTVLWRFREWSLPAQECDLLLRGGSRFLHMMLIFGIIAMLAWPEYAVVSPLSV